VEIAWVPPPVAEASVNVASLLRGEIVWAPPPTAAEAVVSSVAYHHIATAA
jgi:hypothetical protein